MSRILRRRNSALQTLIGAGLMGMLACAPVPSATAPAKPTAKAADPASEEPAISGRLLTQPAFAWSDGKLTSQGTAFFVRIGTGLYAMTSTHFLNRSRKTQLLAANFSTIDGQPLVQSQFVWDELGSGGIDGGIRDYRDDEILMPISRLPASYEALEIDTRKPLPIGEKVWFPNKTEGPLGHARMTGSITDWDPGYIEVRLDQKLELQSQSGSPIISEVSGKVIGILSRGAGRKLIATPVWGWTDVPPEYELLTEMHGRALVPEGAPSHIELSPALPDGMRWKHISGDIAAAKPRPVGSEVEVHSSKAGFRLDFMDSGKPYYGLHFSAAGALSRIHYSARAQKNIIRTAKKKSMSVQQTKEYRARLDGIYSSDMSEIFTQWAGFKADIGTDYSAEDTVEIHGVKARRISAIQAGRLFGCERGGVSRTCVELYSRKSLVEGERERVQDILAKKGGEVPDVPDVRALLRVRLEADTMVPHSYKNEIVVRTGSKQELSVRVVNFRHPPAKNAPKKSAGAIPHQPSKGPATVSGLAKARSGPTALWFDMPAPQTFDPKLTPPSGVEEVTYRSGALSLKGWLARPKSTTKPVGAVVYLHGGFSFGAEDWVSAQPLRDAGFTVFMPRLRGENGGEGKFETFFGEVDDAIAAGEFVAKLREVNSERVFLVGHSAGAMVAALVAELASPYQRVAALSGFLDVRRWLFLAPRTLSCDASDPFEIRRRDPMQNIGDLRVPITLYAEPGNMRDINREFHERAQKAGKKSQLVPVAGDHMGMVEPALKLAAKQFLAHK